MDFSLKAVFGLDATGVRTEIRQLTREVRGYANTWAEIGFAAAAAGFIAVSKGAMTLAASLKDTSEQVGINVESLQALNYLAEQNGASQENMQKALEKTRIFLQKAAEGAESNNDTLSKLGLTTEKLAGLPIERKFEAIAKAYDKATDKGAAYNAVSEIFGEKIGPKMVASLQDLASKGFDATAKAAENAGHVMSAETIVALEQAEQAIDDFKKRITVAVGNIIVNFRTEEGLTLLFYQLRKFGEMFVATLGDAVASGYQMFKATFGAVGIWLRERTQNGLVDAIKAAAELMNKILPSRFQIDISGIEKFRVANEEFSEILARTISQTEPTRFTETLKETWDKIIADQKKLVDAANAVDMKPAADGLRAAGTEAGGALAKGAEKVKEASKSIVADAKEAGAVIEEAYNDGYRVYRDGIGYLIEKMKLDLGSISTQISRQMGTLMSAWQDMDGSRFEYLGARGSAQFQNATDDALAEIVRRNKQKANELRYNGQPLTANYDNRMEAGRLEIEAQNAQRELDLRNNVRRAYESGGASAVYRANAGVDPIILDRLIQQFAQQLPESQRAANALEQIQKGLVRRGLIPQT